MATISGTITSLLQKIKQGQSEAADELFHRVYADLKRLARAQLSRACRPMPLDGTSLVNDACERLLGRSLLDAADRRHFFYLFGRAMHDVLVELARSDMAAKRGGGRRPIALVDFQVDGESQNIELLDLEQAIGELREWDARAAQIVDLRFFGGRSLQETAELLGCSFATVRREWDYARAWLRDRLSK